MYIIIYCPVYDRTSYVFLYRNAIKCVFCGKYVEAIIDLVRDSNVAPPFLAVQYSRLRPCGALTRGMN